jgi:2,3-bisphosphoglycerate-independent phosphoglycerate mutase
MSEYLAGSGVPQYVVSETQKFGHMTYFWNGNRSGKFDPDLETYAEIPSDKVPFDQAPAMKAAEIADHVIAALQTNRYQCLRLNFANGDMVGHTGNLEATIASMEAMDLALARVLEAVKEVRGTLVLTADHGNAEDMIELDADGNPRRRYDGTPRGKTAHTTNPVGFWIYRAEGPQLELRQDLPDAGLANLAATVIELLGFEPPEDYLPSMLA